MCRVDMRDEGLDAVVTEPPRHGRGGFDPSADRPATSWTYRARNSSNVAGRPPMKACKRSSSRTAAISTAWSTRSGSKRSRSVSITSAAGHMSARTTTTPYAHGEGGRRPCWKTMPVGEQAEIVR